MKSIESKKNDTKVIHSNKPCIAILLSAYNPDPSWLREQLISLNEQTYPNIRLYFLDDCSNSASPEKLKSIVEESITAFPVFFYRNESNRGSNASFERLTLAAEGELFAYSDQDDIWEKNKLEKLQAAIASSGAVMSYSDMSVIDREGNKIADSLRDIRPRLRYIEGEGLAETLFFRNPCAGCCMLIDAKTAKRAIPFPKQTVCDQWLAIVAASCGRVCFVKDALVRYRQHGGNQTGILTGVTDWNSYVQRRLVPLDERLKFAEHYFEPSQELKDFVAARLAGKRLEIFKHRRFSYKEALFEIFMKGIPRPIFRRVIERIR